MPAPEVATTNSDPARLALWTDLMDYYLELPRAESAQVLEQHPRMGSQLWIAATKKLGEGLDPALRAAVPAHAG